MISLLVHWMMSSFILLLMAKFMPGLHVAGFGVALMAVFVLSMVNALIAPILNLLALPINLLTLGLFSFVINAGLFWLAAAVVPGFEVNNFITALIASALLALLTGITHNVFPPRGAAT